MLTFGPKLNRSYTFYMPFMQMNIEVSILFHKNNSCLGFNTEKRVYEMHRNDELSSSIYKDLNESVFATTFLDLRSYSSKNLDIKLQFNDIRSTFKNEIVYKANETIKVSKVPTPNGEFESCLYVYIFGFQSYNDDFLFFLAERHHIDLALDKKVVRTYGLQLCSKSRSEDFLQTVDFYNTKESKSKPVEEAMMNVFSDRQKVNTRRI